jgi:hypothetical protein
MGWILLLIAVIAVLTGLLLIFAPRVLQQTEKLLNQLYITDDVIFARRILFGCFLLVASGLMIYAYFLLHRSPMLHF